MPDPIACYGVVEVLCHGITIRTIAMHLTNSYIKTPISKEASHAALLLVKRNEKYETVFGICCDYLM